MKIEDFNIRLIFSHLNRIGKLINFVKKKDKKKQESIDSEMKKENEDEIKDIEKSKNITEDPKTDLKNTNKEKGKVIDIIK